jgi:translation elongation factor EF-Tu-like GTPase
MATKRVVVSGGGDNLYRISIYGDKHTISHVDVGPFTNDYNRIGEARSMDDALRIIKAHSGQSIIKITDW